MPVVIGSGLVTVQVLGMGTMAGPPARVTIVFAVGKAETTEASAAPKMATEESIVDRDEDMGVESQSRRMWGERKVMAMSCQGHHWAEQG